MGLLSSIISVAKGAISAIGGAIGPIAGKLLGIVGDLNPIFKAIEFIAKMIGLFDEKEDMEEIGAKAMKSDKSVDDFDTTADYVKHLREDIELSEEEMENASKETKLARKAVGGAIALKGIGENKGVEVSVEFMEKAVTKGLSANEINTLIDTFSKSKVALDDFVEYTKGRVATVKEEKIDDMMTDILHKSKPELSNEEIEKEVLEFTRQE